MKTIVTGIIISLASMMVGMFIGWCMDFLPTRKR